MLLVSSCELKKKKKKEKFFRQSHNPKISCSTLLSLPAQVSQWNIAHCNWFDRIISLLWTNSLLDHLERGWELKVQVLVHVGFPELLQFLLFLHKCFSACLTIIFVYKHKHRSLGNKVLLHNNYYFSYRIFVSEMGLPQMWQSTLTWKQHRVPSNKFHSIFIFHSTLNKSQCYQDRCPIFKTNMQKKKNTASNNITHS